MKKNLYIYMIILTLTACGGGGGGGSTGSNTNGSSGGTDPAKTPTTIGAGSTVVNAETTQGTIRYSQYQASTNMTNMMSSKTFTVPTVSSNIAYSSASKQGSIQFPVMGTNELISTNDGYATTQWNGPFMSGSYKFNGNILVGCSSSAPTVNEQTQIFVSSNLARVQNGFIDDMNGQTFDLYDCSMLQSNRVGSLKLNADGTMFISTANYTISKNQVFDMLNPESYPGAVISDSSSSAPGFYSGHAFNYTVNGVTKYAIVIQYSASNSSHYLLAVQR